MEKVIKMEELEIKPINKLALIDQIIEVISNLMLEDKLKPGDVLPSERRLSEMLEVSRNSVRQAIKALSVLGVLETRVGSRTYLNKSISKLFINPFKFVSILHNIKAIELFETRKMIEVELVRLATKKATKKDIEKMNSILERSKDFIDKPKEFQYLEKDFHDAIFEASKNRLLTAMMDVINNLLFERKRNTFLTIANVEKALEGHIKIFNAIKNKDLGKAEEAMLEHLDLFLQDQQKVEYMTSKKIIKLKE